MCCAHAHARARARAGPALLHAHSLRHNDAHKWFYYPEMAKDEVLLFKVYDKKEDGPRFVFHTAFSDPRTPEDAPPRRSVEIRAIAFFGDGQA